MDPIFLSVDEVVRLHRDVIERYGGSHGVRDLGLLESAVAVPQAAFGGQYLHRDLFEMGAAYLFHIAQNHPFIDGNKRIAAMAAFVFLDTNGVEITADETAFEEMTMAVADGKADKATVADFFRRRSTFNG